MGKREIKDLSKLPSRASFIRITLGEIRKTKKSLIKGEIYEIFNCITERTVGAGT